MDIEDIVRLRKNWPHLVKYLKSKDPKLLDKLYQHAILNEHEFTALQGEDNPKTRAVRLSAILKQKGQASFERFLVCLRKHYDSLAKKIEKTSVTEAEIEEQLELEKCSSSDYNDSINYPATLGTDVPTSPSVRLTGVGYGRRNEVLGWLTDMTLVDPTEAASVSMSLSEEGGLSSRSTDHLNAPLTPGSKSNGKMGSRHNVDAIHPSNSLAEAWAYRSMRMARTGTELTPASASKLRQSTRTAPIGDHMREQGENNAMNNHGQTQALIHHHTNTTDDNIHHQQINSNRSGPRSPRSKTPEPRNAKPRNPANRDHSVGNVRRVRAQTLTLSANQAILQQQQQHRLSPPSSNPSPSYLVDNRQSSRGVGGGSGGGSGGSSHNNNNNNPHPTSPNHVQQPSSSRSGGSSSGGGGGGIGPRCLNGNESSTSSSPSPLAFSTNAAMANGNITGNHRKLSSSSTSPTSVAPLFTFGREGKGVGEFRFPRNILIDDEQKVYVVDRGNSRIQVFSTAGSYLYQFGIGSKFIGNGSDVWCTTTDIALSKSGNSLICPRVVCAKSAKPWPLSGLSEAAEIQCFTKTGGLISSFKYQELQFGLCVAVNSKGHIIVPDYENPFIYNFNADGCLISRYGGPGKEPGRFDCPTSVCSGIDDDIIVTDSTNQRVHVLDKFGELRTCFGSRGDNVSQFQWPAGVCLDASGCILVSDSVTNRIQMFSYDGSYIRTVADASAGLDHPCGIAVSPDGLLYVADQKNHAIKVFRL